MRNSSPTTKKNNNKLNGGVLMLCERCQEEIPAGEKFNHAGQTLCEDCYMEVISVPKTCDPMAVRSARLAREQLGHTGTDGLLPIQREIYNYLRDRGKATRDEVGKHFGLDAKELEKNFSVLRHCELVKGRKEGDTIYMVLMG
jgi:hypothetical protein